jgi:hypothetical protein
VESSRSFGGLGFGVNPRSSFSGERSTLARGIGFSGEISLYVLQVPFY